MLVAGGPRQLDRDDLDSFVDRWIAWFATAGNGASTMPGTLPEPNGGTTGGAASKSARPFPNCADVPLASRMA